MVRSENSAPDLRVAVPTLEPDPAFLAQLSGMAAGSGAAGPPAGGMGPGWRTGLVTASVATVMVSGAWVAAAVIGDADTAPTRPTSPITHQVDPPTHESDSGSAGADDHADHRGDAPRHAAGRNDEGAPAEEAAPPAPTGVDQGGHDQLGEQPAQDDHEPAEHKDPRDQGDDNNAQGEDGDPAGQDNDQQGDDNGQGIGSDPDLGDEQGGGSDTQGGGGSDDGGQADDPGGDNALSTNLTDDGND